MWRWAYVILSSVLPINFSTSREKIWERGQGMLQKEVVKVSLVPLLLPLFLDTTVSKAWQPPCSCSLPAASIIDAISSFSLHMLYYPERACWTKTHHHEQAALCVGFLCPHVGSSSPSRGTGRYVCLLSISNDRRAESRQEATEGVRSLSSKHRG